MSATPHDVAPQLETVDTPVLHLTLGEFSRGATTTVLGAIAGVATVNKLAPPVLHPTPGVTASVKLTIDRGVEADFGTIGIHAPHALDNLAIGIQTNSTQFPLKLSGPQNTFETIANLANHLPKIADQAQSAIFERLAEGASVGTVIGGIAAYKITRGLRERSLSERARSMSLVRKATAAVGGLAILGSIIYTEKVERNDPIVRAPLPSFITDHNPKLKGAYMTGIDPGNLNDAARSYDYVKNFIIGNKSNPQSTTAIENFTTAYNNAQRSFLWRLSNNPDLITIQQFGDVHCYYPMFSYLGAVLTTIGPKIIVENGDLGTNGGQAIYENKCIPDEIKAVKTAAAANRMIIYMVRVNGNHDAKKSWEVTDPNIKISTLRGSANTTTADGLTFVGADDPINTVWSTVPSSRVETDRALAAQGSKIATTACKITEKTHHAPFVISHEAQGSYEALFKGCAAYAFNAHTHQNGPVKIYYGHDGLKEYQHTVGTASGANVGITIYQDRTVDSTMTTWYIDKNTHKPAAAITEVLHPDNSVEIVNQPLDGDPQIPSAYEKYLVNHYSQTVKVPTKVRLSK